VSQAVTAPLDRAGIEAVIPHREPFLLVDEITELVPGERAAGRLHVREDAWFLRGHFPGRPLLPGVLQLEALAQVGAVCGLSHPAHAGKLALFAGVDGARFKRLVVPGDVLDLSCVVVRLRGSIGKARGEASVAGELACRAELTFALAEAGA
jgi:3-hydroxyacyl-[acyl-carrier-protein] dehydratase